MSAVGSYPPIALREIAKRMMQERTGDKYADGAYLEKNPAWHEEDSAWKAGQIMKMLARHDLQPSSVCEVGCGAGEILNQLREMNPEHVSFVGYEISPQAHQLAVTRTTDRLQFRLANFLETEEQCDLLLVIDVFEHVQDYLGFLRRLRTRGTFKIFHIPLDISVQKVLLSKPIMRRRRQVGHLHYFTKETALATLQDTGYEIVDHFFTSSSLDLPPTSFMYALGRWPLRIATMMSQDLAARILGGHSLMVLAR